VSLLLSILSEYIHHWSITPPGLQSTTTQPQHKANISTTTLATTYLPIDRPFTRTFRPLTCASRNLQAPTKRMMPHIYPASLRLHHPKKSQANQRTQARTQRIKLNRKDVHNHHPPAPHLPAPDPWHCRSPNSAGELPVGAPILRMVPGSSARYRDRHRP